MCSMANRELGIIYKDIQLIPMDSTDLFLCEKLYLTNGPDNDEPMFNKYILVKKNYTYEIHKANLYLKMKKYSNYLFEH